MVANLDDKARPNVPTNYRGESHLTPLDGTLIYGSDGILLTSANELHFMGNWNVPAGTSNVFRIPDDMKPKHTSLVNIICRTGSTDYFTLPARFYSNGILTMTETRTSPYTIFLVGFVLNISSRYYS